MPQSVLFTFLQRSEGKKDAITCIILTPECLCSGLMLFALSPL